MVQLVACLHKFNLATNNYLGPHRYGTFMIVTSFSLCLIFLICPDLMWNQDIKSEINPVLNPRAAGPEGSLMGIPGILCSISLSFVIE